MMDGTQEEEVRTELDSVCLAEILTLGASFMEHKARQKTKPLKGYVHSPALKAMQDSGSQPVYVDSDSWILYLLAFWI